MVAKVSSSKMFNGKVYAKSKPNSCVNDVSNALEFEVSLQSISQTNRKSNTCCTQIAMPYHDLECDVKQPNTGKFSNDIVIQHHDMIVTASDLGLSVHCQYDLSNRSISNNVNLEVDGDVDSSDTHEATVAAPNVTMRITNPNGDRVLTAQVGDTLALRFEIEDKTSKYPVIDQY